VSIPVPPRTRSLAIAPFDVRVQPDRRAVRLHATVEYLVAVGFERVVIDLRELVFIDCAGLRLLCALEEGARDDGWRLAVIQGSAAVRRLFALTDTLGVLPFLASPPARRMRRAIAPGLGARAERSRRRPRSQH